ncbi:MAG: hypothetical protein K0U93_25755 [Gammaproteobacteria bacterium]|nr:hypothetical protein [Gammaproteobacteria bacterium]
MANTEPDADMALRQAKEMGLETLAEQFPDTLIEAARAARRYIRALESSSGYPTHMYDEPAHAYRVNTERRQDD